MFAKREEVCLAVLRALQVAHDAAVEDGDVAAPRAAPDELRRFLAPHAAGACEFGTLVSSVSSYTPHSMHETRSTDRPCF